MAAVTRFPVNTALHPTSLLQRDTSSITSSTAISADDVRKATHFLLEAQRREAVLLASVGLTRSSIPLSSQTTVQSQYANVDAHTAATLLKANLQAVTARKNIAKQLPGVETISPSSLIAVDTGHCAPSTSSPSSASASSVSQSFLGNKKTSVAKSKSRISQTNSVEKSKTEYPDDAPRRPLSAYNFFFSSEREKILAELHKSAGGGGEGGEEGTKEIMSPSHQDPDLPDAAAQRVLMRQKYPEKKKRRPHRKTHGKIGFRDLAKTIGAAWRSLPSQRVSHYRKLAEMDRQRYRSQMLEYSRERERQGLPPAPATSKKKR